MQMREWLGELVDPDQIARELKPENPRGANLSADREAVKRIRSLIKNGVNFAIETTLSGSFVLKHMEIAKANSYEIVVYYIGLEDVQMHIDRVASRVEQGGHWIAEEDIRYRYGQSLKNLIPALAIVDQVIITDPKKYVMNIFCVVTDEERGIALVKKVLRESQLDYTRILIATMPYGTEGSYTLKFASKKGVTEFSL